MRVSSPGDRRRVYAPLWCKSGYSFLEGASRPEELVQRCHEHGLPALAITDRDGVYGVVRAHGEAQRLGLHLIIGSQISVDDGSSILLLCQDREGYANLCRLISTGRLRSPKGQSCVRWSEVCTHAGGLIALWGCGGLMAGRHDPEPVARALKQAFGNRLYGFFSRHRLAEEKAVEARIRARAERYGIALVAAGEVLYHCRSRRRLQDVMTCIRLNVTLEEAGRSLKPNDEYDLKAAEEIAALYADEPALLERTVEIARRCTFSLDEIHYRYPSESLPDGRTSYEHLRSLTFQGARKRYGKTVPPGVTRQLEKELALIEELDYCGYFLTMWELVDFCRLNGILCQGRGSAANSAVCYCLGITAVDPVRMELLFERFISRERAEPPDIDLDIEHRRREEVIQHMYEKYGRARAAMVANFVRYRLRSAVRDVGRALGMPGTTLDRTAKLLPHYFEGDLEACFEQSGLDLAGLAPLMLCGLVDEIQYVPPHLSINPGGFLLGSEPIAAFVPVENASMPGRTVIQWDKYDVEDMNLFKVDLLGLGALTHLDYCFRLLKEHRGLSCSMATIPGEDPALFEMVSRADTVGVFQIESRAQMSMLPRLKPRCFYDLVIEISIVRPGPIAGGMVHPYLRRRNGEEPVVYPHASLEAVLKKTLGVPLFQEQVMRLAVVAAGYTPGEADQLRRDMAAWRKSGRIEKHEKRLIDGMMKKGIGQEFAERVFSQIRGFGEYGFPESHAASFALIAYCTAWLKCHYPVEFTCGILNAWPMGFYAPSTLIEDAKRHGVQVLPVDVLHSDWYCTLVPADGADSFPGNSTKAAHPFAVRMGLRFVKSLSERDWERIQSARGTGFRSVEDVAARTGLDERTLALLAESGAFGSLGQNRRPALWAVSGAARLKGLREEHADRSGPMAKGSLGLEEREIEPRFPELTELESIVWDYASTGHSADGHPLEPFRDELTGLGLPDALGLARKKDGSRVSYAGLVICRQRPGTAGGVVFMTLEDESGFVNLVLWQKVFQRFRTVILTNSLLGVTGKLQSQNGVVHVIVESCWKPRLSYHPPAKQSRDFH